MQVTAVKEISFANSFRNLEGTKSGPDALYGFSLLSNFFTQFIVTAISGMIGLLGDVIFGHLSSPSEKTLTNCLFSKAAFALLSI